MSYEAVLFDLDGTLLDTLDDLTSALNHTLSEDGFGTRSREEVRSYLGNGFARLVTCALPQGASTPGFDSLLAGFASYYNAHCQEKTAPYPGILDMLSSLKDAGVKMAVVSNKGEVAVRELVKYHFDGIVEPFHAFGQRDGIRRKPEPDMVIHAMDVLGTGPEGTLYVGDSDVDYLTAKNAGIDCALVSWGFKGRTFLEGLGARCIVDDVSEIEDICLKSRRMP